MSENGEVCTFVLFYAPKITSTIEGDEAVYFTNPFVFEEHGKVLKVKPSSSLDSYLPGISNLEFMVPKPSTTSGVKHQMVAKFNKDLQTTGDVIAAVQSLALFCDRRRMSWTYQSSALQFCMEGGDVIREHQCRDCKVTMTCGKFAGSPGNHKICVACWRRDYFRKYREVHGEPSKLVYSVMYRELLGIGLTDIEDRKPEYAATKQGLSRFIVLLEDGEQMLRDLYIDMLRPEPARTGLDHETHACQTSWNGIDPISLKDDRVRIHWWRNMGPTARRFC